VFYNQGVGAVDRGGSKILKRKYKQLLLPDMESTINGIKPGRQLPPQRDSPLKKKTPEAILPGARKGLEDLPRIKNKTIPKTARTLGTTSSLSTVA
jgi:hypothetical protein